MKKLYIFIILLCGCCLSAQTISFSDPVFKNWLVNIPTDEFTQKALDANDNPIIIDANDDGEIQESEAETVYTLFSYSNPISGEFTNLAGIEHFINLKKVHFVAHKFIDVDLTALQHLEEANFIYNYEMQTLNVSNLTNLKKLVCKNDTIETLLMNGSTNLEIFDFQWNNLTEIDLTGHTALIDINLSGNDFTSITVENLPNLTKMQIGGQLTSVTLNNLPLLEELDLSNNHLSSIDLSNLSALKSVNLNTNNFSTLDFSYSNTLLNISTQYNSLQSINLSGCSSLEQLSCPNNQLSALDLSACTSLNILFCSNNPLQSLDLSNCLSINTVSAYNTQLEYLNIKNGREEQVYISDAPLLKHICVDDFEIDSIQQIINDNQYTDCVINTYCSFVPGGEYYTISGTTSFSANGDCNSESIAVPFQAINVSNDLNAGTFISAANGDYSIALAEDTHTFTPTNPNPAYYAVSPESVTLTFPAESNPYIQNFCITPLGVFNDLEITLLPITPARPGFDAKYRLIYINKGTTEQLAGISFTYNGSVLEYVSSTLTPTISNSGVLFWELGTIKPFEQGIIDILLNVNSPVEIPAVNNGDILSFEANIQSPIPENTDETPIDNTYTLNQTVVGSFDPNDKTCVEGTIIHPDMAGEYVTYLIRFENTGTYYAENIVVKDVIDGEKFDISSLQPLQSSHPFVTRIKDNTAEFIFENTMLPGTPSEDRHGFVAFKIKTKATLQLDDSFSNTAAIYFDFNAPIITNEAVTTFGVLGTDDFDFTNSINVYPNPASTILNINVKDSFDVNSFEVYTMMGQRVLEIQNPGESSAIDIARLASGTYILKGITDKGSAHTKFIKK